MAKQTFTWDDGKTHEFDDFDPVEGRRIGIDLPSRGKSRGSIYADLIVRVEDYAYRNGAGPSWQATPEQKKIFATEDAKIRVGILASNVNNGLPKGIYLPYRIENRRVTLMLDGLEGDFIFTPSLKPTEAQPVEADA